MQENPASNQSTTSNPYTSTSTLAPRLNFLLQIASRVEQSCHDLATASSTARAMLHNVRQRSAHLHNSVTRVVPLHFVEQLIDYVEQSHRNLIDVASTTRTAISNIQQLSAPPVLTGYNRIPHAAHYEGSYSGHDLDRWVIRSEAQPTVEQVAALGVAADAKCHSGYIHNGEQHWIYTAIRPLSIGGACPTCEAGTP